MFRGRKVYNNKSYPTVWWPEHPVAMADGTAYIHRIVALEKFGNIPDGFHVHHKDQDKNNWSKENLELMSSSNHARLHSNSLEIEVRCLVCRKMVVVRNRRRLGTNVFCSRECSSKNQEKIQWPSKTKLIQMVSETSYSEAGRILGVSDNAIRKRLNNASVD